ILSVVIEPPQSRALLPHLSQVRLCFIMRITRTSLVISLLILVTGAAAAQTLRLDRDGGFSFKFGRDDRRGDVEGKRASCEVYARIAQVQADANARFRCGLRGPAWVSDPAPTHAGPRNPQRKRALASA